MAEPTEASEDLSAQKEALTLIADFGDRLCKDIPIEGSGSTMELSASATAELSGLIKKFVDLGMEGAAKYEKSNYKGLLQKDLVDALKDVKNCRLEVFRDLRSLVQYAGPRDTDARCSRLHYDDHNMQAFQNNVSQKMPEVLEYPSYHKLLDVLKGMDETQEMLLWTLDCAEPNKWYTYAGRDISDLELHAYAAYASTSGETCRQLDVRKDFELSRSTWCLNRGKWEKVYPTK